MTNKITKKELEEALDTYSNLVEMYPDNEAYLQRYADMLQTMGRHATATTTLQHLHDLICKRSEKEAGEFAKKYPQIGRILPSDVIFSKQDKHAIAGKIIFELLGTIWLKLHQKKFHEGQVIFHSTDINDSLTLVIDGKVDAYAVGPNQEHTLVETIGSLDVLGEHTVLKPGKMRVDAFVASNTAIIVEIPRKKMLSMMEKNTYLSSLLSQRALFRTNVHAITGNPVFRTLPLKLSQHLARSITIRNYEAGSLIYKLDQQAQGVDIVLRGKACYLAADKNGKKFKLPPVPPQSLMGDLTVKGPKSTHIAEVIAHTKVTLAHISYEDLLNVTVAFPPLKESLVQHADRHQLNMMQGIASSQLK